ncbi:MAG: hypothetical protein KIT72_15660 [Polyangiaceae bacterium]|nr:hypothetical protein [Polyangiaceae bacterium]MCW5791852.1 hypothetical protein [Polyangiaceae bacterium]
MTHLTPFKPVLGSRSPALRFGPQSLGMALSMAMGLALLAGCGGGGQEPAHDPSDVDSGQSERRRSGGDLAVSAAIGALDPGEVTATFQAALPDFERCMAEGARQVEFLGGGVEFELKIDRAGALTEAFVSRSSLGDRTTEDCLLGALRKRTWPKPQGGEHGLAKKAFDFDQINDVRPPVLWSAEQVTDALAGARSELDQCKNGAQGSFEATVYVGTEGQPLGVGLSQTDAADAGAVRCLVGVLRGLTFPSPGSWPSKVSFQL